MRRGLPSRSLHEADRLPLCSTAIQRVPATRLDPRAIGHEIGAAGRPNGVALLRRRSLRSNPMDLERNGQCGKRKQFKKSGHDATPTKRRLSLRPYVKPLNWNQGEIVRYTLREMRSVCRLAPIDGWQVSKVVAGAGLDALRVRTDARLMQTVEQSG